MTMKVTVKKVPGTTHIVVHIPKHSHYPLEPALVTLRNGKLPTHVLLATTALLNTRARESAGDPVRRRASLSVALLAQSCVALLAQSRRRIELKADDASSSKQTTYRAQRRRIVPPLALTPTAFHSRCCTTLSTCLNPLRPAL